jgi:hypothetical protein
LLNVADAVKLPLPPLINPNPSERPTGIDDGDIVEFMDPTYGTSGTGKRVLFLVACHVPCSTPPWEIQDPDIWVPELSTVPLALMVSVVPVFSSMRLDMVKLT